MAGNEAAKRAKSPASSFTEPYKQSAERGTNGQQPRRNAAAKRAKNLASSFNEPHNSSSERGTHGHLRRVNDITSVMRLTHTDKRQAYNFGDEKHKLCLQRSF